MLAVGIVGALAELLLLGHYEEPLQLVPLTALGLGALALATFLFVRRRWALRFLQTVMAGFVLAGGLGILSHYRGNVEFARELYPELGGWELFVEAMTGATPALAPGTMALLGVLGLIYCYGYPVRSGGDPDDTTLQR